MKSLLFSVSVCLLICGSVTKAQCAEFVEIGRFGVEAVVTASTVQGGLVYVSDWLDSAIDLYGGHSKFSDSLTSNTSQENTIGGQLRAGKRFNIKDFNYLDFGVEYTTTFGTNGGVSLNGSYSVGPYIGLQRHFSGTNLMLTVFIFPYAHSVSNSNDGAGGQAKNTSENFLTNGGFGLAYLF